ncbi:hypothetical protein GNI_134010 [Gregarina niphandrodes]|uniref:Uncharacterized protein n=1 Tax=Gregarina niphandrodes TaxID=110365 RepID=A0A023B1C7_GRENI|nr:hypothetical protein GNI_134010 [Gregarina niphandrodes]EZG46378.1 hypothetical protein GNI_134010 [Gregarina niphandrodes]|eukprot:XP_011132306.1 hypothetical protein GNI_134010 [Gregarina niphandrodes]
MSGFLARNLASMLELDRRATEVGFVINEAIATADTAPLNNSGRQAVEMLCQEQQRYLNEKIAIGEASLALVRNGKSVAQKLIEGCRAITTTSAANDANDDSTTTVRHSLRRSTSSTKQS